MFVKPTQFFMMNLNPFSFVSHCVSWHWVKKKSNTTGCVGEHCPLLDEIRLQLSDHSFSGLLAAHVVISRWMIVTACSRGGFCCSWRLHAALCITGSTEIYCAVHRLSQLWNNKRGQTAAITGHIIGVFEWIFNSLRRIVSVTNQSHISFPRRLFVPLDHIKIGVWMAAVYLDLFSMSSDHSSGSLLNAVFWEICRMKKRAKRFRAENRSYLGWFLMIWLNVTC